MLKRVIDTVTLTMAVLLVALAFLSTTMVSAASGVQNKPLSKTELKALITNAETKGDHERIAQYFDAEAAKYEAEAKEHGELAPFYREHTPQSAKFPGSMQTFQHCDALSKSLQTAAGEARQLAAEHRAMAQAAKK